MDSLTTYRILNSVFDEICGNGNFLVAPIAEYKGVALLERAGTVKKVYRGKEYTTDGKIYLLLRQRERPDVQTFMVLPDERTVKFALDQPDAEPEKYLSYPEVCRMLGMEPVTANWMWDEEFGQFHPDAPAQ